MDELFLEKLPLSFREDITNAITLLKKEGCTEIFIFGSLAVGNYNEQSDIDFAVKGLHTGKYFEVGGKLMFLLKHNFDLIKLDDERSSFVQIVKQNKVIVRVA